MQHVGFAPNLFIKQGAKLVTNAEDVIERLATPVRAALLQLEAVASDTQSVRRGRPKSNRKKDLRAA